MRIPVWWVAVSVAVTAGTTTAHAVPRVPVVRSYVCQGTATSFTTESYTCSITPALSGVGQGTLTLDLAETPGDTYQGWLVLNWITTGNWFYEDARGTMTGSVPATTSGYGLNHGLTLTLAAGTARGEYEPDSYLLKTASVITKDDIDNEVRQDTHPLPEEVTYVYPYWPSPDYGTLTSP